MATGQQLIEDSLLLIGVGAPGDTLESGIINNALRQLNRMLSTFSAEGGPIFVNTFDSVTWTADAQSRTIGATGDIAVTRPIDILSLQTRVSNIDYSVDEISFPQYQAILIKDIGSDFPDVFAYEKTFPNGTLYLHPAPTSNVTVRITSLKPLADLTLSGTVALPEGYEEMIQYNLAVRLAPIHGTVATPAVVDQAFNTKRAVIEQNTIDTEMWPDYHAPDAGDYDDYWRDINRS